MNINVKHYDGLGNTFAIIKYDTVSNHNFKELAIQICNHEDFDTDGLIIVKTNPLEMIFYNRDGSYSTMCGNGIRCFAKYIKDEGILADDVTTFDVVTGAGILQVDIIDVDPFLCRIQMGQPIFTPEAVKLADDGPLDRRLKLGPHDMNIHALFMGTIHTIVFVEQINDFLTGDLGEKICNHPLFTEKTNVNFVEIQSYSHLMVRTYERGVGWTKACGTGCCAAAVVAKKLGHVHDKDVCVHLEEGNLIISGTSDVYMTGPARYNYSRTFSNQR